jgi:hypothetical protein
MLRRLLPKRPPDPMKDVLDSLEYDFTHFELAHFVEHMESLRRKPIYLKEMTLSSKLFGIWVPTESQDYLIYNATLQPVHQIHTILHEIAHMVLDHSLHPLTDILLPEQLQSLMEGRLRFAPSANYPSDPEEREAEAFVFAIQRQVVKAQRLHELTGESSSIVGLRAAADASGYTS